MSVSSDLLANSRGQLQWLPATIYPNLIASLGIEGSFRLWAEDPSAAPGRRFCAGGRGSSTGRPAFDTRSASKSPYRSFSLRHTDADVRHTHLALLAADGRLTVYENDQPEDLSEYTAIDEFAVCPRPPRGEEVAFTVRFDPNPEPCYAAIRAGVPSDAIGLAVAAMTSVRIYRSRDVLATSYGLQTAQKEFYLAADIQGHRGLVRDIAWAPGNIRGYDIIATACQDGYARVFRLEAPYAPNDGKSWSASLLKASPATNHGVNNKDRSGTATPVVEEVDGKQQQNHHQQPQQQQSRVQGNQQQQQQQQQGHHQPSSSLSASLAKSGAPGERHWTGQPGQIKHTYREISKLDSNRTPIWRVGFDDDGQILGTTGDDGRLLCYRQTPDGSWAKSSELAMMKTRMAVP